MADLNEPIETAEKAPRAKPPRSPRGNGRPSRKRHLPEAKLLEFAELLFFAYRDFTRDPDTILEGFRLRPRASPRAAFRQPPLGPARGRPARHSDHHQAEPQPRAQAADRQGLYRAAGGRFRPPRAPAVSHRQGPRSGRAAGGAAIGAAGRGAEEAGPGAEAVLRRFLEAMVNAEERPKVSTIMAATPVPLKEGGKGEGS